MPSWADILDLQRRSRRNAQHAAARLRRRRADADEALHAAVAAPASFLDGAHNEPPQVALSPEPEAESRYHPADRLLTFDV